MVKRVNGSGTVFYVRQKYASARRSFQFRFDNDWLPTGSMITATIDSSGAWLHIPDQMDAAEIEDLKLNLKQLLKHFAPEISVEQWIHSRVLVFCQQGEN